ncbi:MAG: hypothetical protein ACREUL_09340 [Steroidobacteraceae bacterium]
MNAIQKTTFAASALAITLLGAALVTAPLAFARPVPAAAQVDCPTPRLQLVLSGHVECHGASRDAGLVALNRG